MLKSPLYELLWTSCSNAKATNTVLHLNAPQVKADGSLTMSQPSVLYLLSTEAESGKSSLALALFDALALRVARPAIFRPVTASGEDDFIIDLLVGRLPPSQRPHPDDCYGVTYDEWHEDEDSARETIIERYRDLASEHDGILVVGSDYVDVGANTELDNNIAIALDLGAPAVVIISGRDARGPRSADDVAAATEHALEHLATVSLNLLALVANRVDGEQVEDVLAQVEGVITKLEIDLPVSVVPELALLAAPTLSHVREATDARLVRGSEESLDRIASPLVIAAMTVENVLARLKDECLVIIAGDRLDVLLGTLAAGRAEGFPTPNGIILTGGFEPDPVTSRLIEGFPGTMPILISDMATFEVATRAAALSGRMRATSHRKIDAAKTHTDQWFPAADVLDRIRAGTSAVTPLMFSHDVFERAASSKKHIVLPEGTEPRILRAASTIVNRGIADITLLGQPAAVAQAANEAGVDVSAAKVISPVHDKLRDRFADVYAEARAHKGVTRDQAWDTVTDVSYFGTLMVHLGLADGMVSGSIHTTAHTIRPSFEIVKTAPGVNVVSSVFFMLLPDEVLVYGDCAVVPDPTSEQLADIAISSAGTATMFGVDPRVAMLSYSTGESGSGAEVEKVREATELVKERRPDLLVEGPLQYDAAVEPSVAAKKMPDSEVAGKASVLIFPDLNTGNNTYKAVQRSAGAVAVGPVLQGLKKPVNDLSRGSTVDDIIMTIAVTAIQAQNIGDGGSSS